MPVSAGAAEVVRVAGVLEVSEVTHPRSSSHLFSAPATTQIHPHTIPAAPHWRRDFIIPSTDEATDLKKQTS